MSFLQDLRSARNEQNSEVPVTQLGRSAYGVALKVLVVTALALLVVLGVRQIATTGYAVEPDWGWYMTDTHVHSSFSSDAYADVGIHAEAAKALGYDSIFLTDHSGGSSFHINRMDANNMFFDDSYTRWTVATYGGLTSSTNELVTSPVNTGTHALNLEASAGSGSYGETMVWTKRGPNFRSGDIILQFSVYPTRIDPGSGFYVSASIGGDLTVVKNPTGYTTTQGVVSPGTSTVLVWQIGSPRSPSSNPQARVLTYDLGNYTLNEWNHFEINVSDYLDDIPTGDQPLDHNGLIHLKMAAAARGGTVQGFFDTYSITASNPVDPADEFVYRTSVIDDFNSPTFTAYPGYEMGQQKHAIRLNYGITDPDQYVQYQFGTDGIVDTQSSGYPAQMNHPGVTISTDEVIDTLAHGADLLEVREDEWLDVWDEILNRGRQIVGIWSSDSHNAGSGGRPSTFIYAPARDMDSLLHSLFEGRVYNARNITDGRMTFNLDGSAAPYSARYPVYLSPDQSTIDVHLDIDGGLNRTRQVVWYRNGEVFATDSVSGSTYSAVKSIPLDGALTNVRAEVRASSGALRATTQSIAFVDLPDLPSDRQFSVDRIVNPDNRDYTILKTKGINGSIWSPIDESLTLTLENLTGALVTVQIATPDGPERIRVDGNEVSPSASVDAFHSATDSTWYHDAGAGLLYLKARHTTSTADVRIAFSDVQDNEPPSAPENLVANVISGSRVDLSWSAATDNIAVAGYDVFRNDQLLVTLGDVLTHTDTTVEPETEYTYHVIARDGASNLSPPSDPVTITTGPEAIFSDGFETGDLSLWSNSTGISVQDQDVFAGSYAAQAIGDGSAAYADKQLPAAQNELHVRLRFKLNSQGPNSVYLMRSRTSTGSSLMGMFVNSSGRLGYRNDVAGLSNTSSLVVSKGQWHDLQVRVKVEGDNGEIEVWYDGARVDSLSRTEAFGSSPIGRIQIGENANGRTFDLLLDGVVVNTDFLDAGGDTEPPTAPQNLTAIAAGGTRVDLAWDPSSDNRGVDSYDVYRDGEFLDNAGNVTSFSDMSAASSTTYTYQVRARDRTGNVSDLSNEAVVTTPEFTVFVDSFESGDMSLWNTETGITVQDQDVYVGSYAARATGTGSATYAQHYLEVGYPETFYQVRFKVVSKGANNVYLLRNRTGTGSSIMGVYLSTTGRLSFRNDVASRSVISSTVVTPGEWHTVQVRVNVNGEAGEIEVWYDGTRVDALSRVENFGANPIGRVQLGENASGRIYDVVFDEVIVDTEYIDIP